MKTKGKRIIALLLVTALCLSTAPFSVPAEAAYTAGEVTSAPEEDPAGAGSDAAGVSPNITAGPDIDPGTMVSEDPGSTEGGETMVSGSPVTGVPGPGGSDEGESADGDAPEGKAPRTVEELEGEVITRITDAPAGGIALFAAPQTGVLYTLYQTSFPHGSPGYTASWGTLSTAVSHMMMTGGAYKAAYCLDQELGYQSGATHTTGGTNLDDMTGQGKGRKREVIGYILANGFQWSSSAYWSQTDNDRWLATQLLIWSAMKGDISIRDDTHVIGVNKSVRDDIVKISSKVYSASSFVAYYDSLVKKLSQARVIPSFCTYPEEVMNDDVLKAQEVNRILLDNNGSEYSKKVTDTNKVLRNFAPALTKPGLIKDVNITASGNSLTLSTTVENAEGRALSEYKPQGGSDALLAWRYAPDPTSYQRFASFGPATGAVKAQLTLNMGNPDAPAPPGSSYLVKVSEDDQVAGISFTATGGGKTFSLTTDANGQIDLSGLPLYEMKEEEDPDTGEINMVEDPTKPITYTISENTPVRYVIPPSQTFTPANGPAALEFENRLKKWRVSVTKSDRETGSTAQGDATLAGAMYGLYKDGDLLDTYITDTRGKFTTDYYPCGSGYTLEEITPSTGYLVTAGSVAVGMVPGSTTVEYNDTALGVDEQVIKGKIRLTKHTDQGDTGVETPEEGAEFQVYLSSSGSFDAAKPTEREVLVIDGDGLALSKDLPYGLYTVHQTKGWEGKEKVADFQVFVCEDGETYAFILNNRVFEALITILKRDAETGRTIPVSGVGFKVRNVQTGDFVIHHINYPTPQDISVYYTDVTGRLMLPEKLVYGNYELIEQQSAYGYVLDKDPIPFTVDGTVKEVVVEKANLPQKGIITVYKEGEVFSSVESRGENGPYLPVYNKQGLPGAVFHVFAAEDIYTPDGTLRVPMGEQVATLTTDSTGIAATGPLYLGKYQVQEITAPAGYVLNVQPKYVELTYAGQEIDLTSGFVTVTDARQKADISLRKSMEKDEDFKLGSNGEYQNVLFGLFAAEEIRAADGSIIPMDGLLERITLDEYGNGKFTADLPLGSYYVQELATNDHYILSDTKWPLEFAYAGQTIVTNYLHVNEGNRVENILKRGAIDGHKVDEDGLQLAGALMGLFFPTETEFTQDKAIMTSTSDLAGDFRFEDVPYGSWIVREIQAPKGFVLPEKSYPVTVTENGEQILLDAENEFIKGDVELEKVDAGYTGQRLSGAVFDVYADSNGDKTYNRGDVKIGTLKEGETGLYSMEGLRYGGYFAVESAAPQHYRLDAAPHYFEIREDEAHIQLTVEDAPQLGDLLIQKSSEDGRVEGIRFRVSGKPYTGGSYEKEFETDENGEIFITGLRTGIYTVSEILDESTVRYRVERDKTAAVTYGDSVLVKFYNKLRRGSVSVLKRDEEGNLLTGAIFKVYRDVDFDQQFDSDTDTFYSDLESDSGVYWLDGLANGGYFLHEETAPEGFVTDKEYHYFEIDEDTTQIEITNTPEPKAGFVNRHITGTLKIIKKAANSKELLKGANFCVKDADGEVVAEGTTNEKGEVFFEKLRYGKYTYQEIYAPDGYILNNEEVPFEINKHEQVIEVEVENTKYVWYTPVTGDGRINPLYIIGAMIAALAAIGVILWRRHNKRRRKKKI